MLYLVYLDEFGHVGPYNSRNSTKYNENPVFGLGGIILPYESVREFSTWFYKRKQELFAKNIKKSGKHPSVWEKKGSEIYNTKNHRKNIRPTKRMFKKIKELDGCVFYVGTKKNIYSSNIDPSSLYLSVLSEAMKRINQFSHSKKSSSMILMDEHPDRENILTKACQNMYGFHTRYNKIIEPPFQMESERYQICQCSDWICGLLGKLAAYIAEPDEWSDLYWASECFEADLRKVSQRSSIRYERSLPRIKPT